MLLTTVESSVGLTSSHTSQSSCPPSSLTHSPSSLTPDSFPKHSPQQENPSTLQSKTLQSKLRSKINSHELSEGQPTSDSSATLSQLCHPLPNYFNTNSSQSSTREVLLIDPEDDVREITQTGLELTTDWRIVTAHSYPQGLEIAKTRRPHAILLNVESHQSCFIHIFRQLKENPITQDIPVILLIDRVRLCDEQRFAQLGITAVIAKPFDCVALGQRIAYLLDW